MLTVVNPIIYMPGQLYRLNNCHSTGQISVLNTLVSLVIQRRRGCQAGRHKQQNIDVIDASRMARQISERQTDTSRISVHRTVQWQQSSRPHSTASVIVHNIPCFNVLNPTSLAKAEVFITLVSDANSISADIVVTESWFKSKHPDNALSIPDFKNLQENHVKRI